ncbi:hypothetical protein ANCDUO_08438 [Ancylostoma duodenale]|uniref:Uncharacterized protein n=1 Tax=Ancylostoma duodenale TaxID=51022 RepID=A0A0C2GQB4_9BILA|nr:hypothetical protein ANCDUO_08438 [Ancylostoma duodenale]
MPLLTTSTKRTICLFNSARKAEDSRDTKRNASAYAKLSKIRWAGRVMHISDNRWTGSAND